MNDSSGCGCIGSLFSISFVKACGASRQGCASINGGSLWQPAHVARRGSQQPPASKRPRAASGQRQLAAFSGGQQTAPAYNKQPAGGVGNNHRLWWQKRRRLDCVGSASCSCLVLADSHSPLALVMSVALPLRHEFRLLCRNTFIDGVVSDSDEEEIETQSCPAALAFPAERPSAPS